MVWVLPTLYAVPHVKGEDGGCTSSTQKCIRRCTRSTEHTHKPLARPCPRSFPLCLKRFIRQFEKAATVGVVVVVVLMAVVISRAAMAGGAQRLGTPAPAPAHAHAVHN